MTIVVQPADDAGSHAELLSQGGLYTCRLTGGLDADGKLVGLRMRISGQSIATALAPQNLKNGMDPSVFSGLNPGGEENAFGYQIPNLLIDHAMRNPHPSRAVARR
jgi:hypothetical protein